MLRAGFLVNSDHLRRLGWIQRLDLVLRADHLPADYKIVFSSELRMHLTKRITHRSGILRVREIKMGAISELPPG